MQKKLTITVDEIVYAGLHKNVGRGNISKFIEGLVRPHVAQPDLAKQYRAAARDAAREAEANEWAEGLLEKHDEAR
jgi:hypothetical protein